MRSSPLQGLTRPGPSTPAFGEQLRAARLQRGLSQLQLATLAQVSTRHLSCLETGRSVPSREMVLRLAQCLEVPVRERNTWLVAAGFAAMYGERSLQDPELAAARAAVQLLLACQEPFPAIAMDRHWNLVAANRAAPVLLGAAEPSLMPPCVNVLRLCHRPAGLSERIVNLAQLREHHLQRLRRQIRLTADPVLADLLAELQACPEPPAAQALRLDGEHPGVVAPFRIRSPVGVLSFFTATTIFGSVTDITLSEMSMELFLPADGFTAEAVPRLLREAGWERPGG